MSDDKDENHTSGSEAGTGGPERKIIYGPTYAEIFEAFADALAGRPVPILLLPLDKNPAEPGPYELSEAQLERFRLQPVLIGPKNG